MDKKSLDIIVEKFFDTGKLVLNENYWDDTVRIFTNLRKNPQTVDQLLDRYDSIRKGIYSDRIERLNDMMVNNEISVFDFIEGLQSDEVDEEEYKEDGVIFPTTDTTEVEDEKEVEVSDEESKEEPLYISDKVVKLTNPIQRKNQIKKQNNTPLLPLSRNYRGDKDSELYKSNLRLLQYILWKGAWTREDIGPTETSELKNEIDNSEFGEMTDMLLRLFQTIQMQKEYKDNNEPDYILYFNDGQPSLEWKEGSIPMSVYKNLPQRYKNEGIVDKGTWDKLMKVMEDKEIKKLESIPDSEGNIDRIVDKSQIKTIDPNNDTFDQSKRDMFKSLSLKFFNNLHNNEIYKTTFQKQWGDLQQKFLDGIERVREIEELEKDREDFINQFPNVSKGVLRSKFDRGIENLKSTSNNIDGEPIEFWENYKDRWDEINRRTGGGSIEGKKELNDLQKEYVKYRNRRSTIEGIYEKIIDKLKEALRGRILSINEINTILHNVNDSLYEVFDTDRRLTTQINNARNLIKNLFDKLSKKDDIDVYDVVDFLKNINTRKLRYDVYEKSFCGCEGNYFRGCNGKEGDKSKLFNTAVKEIKKYLDGDFRDLTITGASESIYNLIIDTETTNADKYDIISNSAVTLTNNVVIPEGKKIEVKKYDESSSYTLSEFIGLYKKQKDIVKYKYENAEYYKRYNKIIEDIVRRLNLNDNGLANSFINNTEDDDKLFGVFVSNYMFYKYDQIEVFWDTDSDQKRFSDEFRITLKFRIKDNEQRSQWVTGNCNLNEPNTIEESITNFFDTGNFDF